EIEGKIGAPDDATASPVKDVSRESASSGNAGRAHVNPGIRSDHSTNGVIDREARVADGSEITTEIEGKGGAPDDATGTPVKDVSRESASSGNAGRAHVHPGIRSDHSTSTSGVIDREVRVAAGSEIATEIEGKVGGPDDATASPVEDVSNESASSGNASRAH